MRSHHVIERFLAPGLVFLGTLGLLATAAPAAEYYLVAKSVDVTMPDSTSIPMWGFALDEDVSPANGVGDCWEGNPNSAACTGLVATVPGPELSLASGDSTLTIHLTNLLANHPVSIVVPGQELPAGSTPVFGGGGDPSRVRSFTNEAAADGGQETYEWTGNNAFRPGSFFYQSGSHVQVQVQMGLYGAVSRPFAAGQAYDGVAYDSELFLLFSEIDPALHQAVDDGSYGTTGPTSTLDYQPKYFLINGQPRAAGDACLSSGAGEGDAILLRMANAGLRELVPMILGSHWEVVAEAGNAYPFPREQYSVLLQPGTSKDVVFTPSHEGEFPIIERRFNLTNAAATDGGMQLCLAVGPDGPNAAPTADANGPYGGTAGQSIAFDGSGSSDPDGDTLTYGWDFGDGNGGTGVTPSHTYAQVGSQTVYNVTLTVDDGKGGSDIDATTATVDPNGAPTADADGPYEGRTGFEVAFDGSGSSDPDGDALGYSWDFGDGNMGSGETASHSYAAAGSYAVTLTVDDGVNTPVVDATSADVTDNSAPVADPNGPYEGSVGESIAFDGSGSSDADGDPLTYSWNFGDGNSGTGISPSHAYGAPGTFTVTLVVNDGFEDSAQVTTSATTTGSPGNEVPVAVDDAFNPNEVAGTAAVAAPGVLGNDTDDGNLQPLEAQLVAQDENLTNLVLNQDGSFSWTPTEQVGVFSFTYQASDGEQLSNVATVAVTREIRIRKAEFNGGPQRWVVSGNSSAPGTVTIYLGPTTGGTVLGTASVAGNGNWSFSQTVGQGAPVPGSATAISADNLGTTGGAVLDRPINFKN